MTGQKTEAILDRNGMPIAAEKEARARHTVALLGLLTNDPRHDPALAEARVGWPAFRIAEYLGMPSYAIERLQGR